MFAPAAAPTAGGWAPIAGLAWMAVASALFAVMTLTTRLASRDLPWSGVALARAAVSLAVAMLHHGDTETRRQKKPSVSPW